MKTYQFVADPYTGVHIGVRETDDGQDPVMVRDIPMAEGNADFDALATAYDLGQIPIAAADPPPLGDMLRQYCEQAVVKIVTVSLGGHDVQVMNDAPTRSDLVTRIQTLLLYNDGRTTDYPAVNGFFTLTAAQLMQLLQACDGWMTRCNTAQKAVVALANQVPSPGWSAVKSAFDAEMEDS